MKKKPGALASGFFSELLRAMGGGLLFSNDCRGKVLTAWVQMLTSSRMTPGSWIPSGLADFLALTPEGQRLWSPVIRSPYNTDETVLL
jgi:hypothetical protein